MIPDLATLRLFGRAAIAQWRSIGLAVLLFALWKQPFVLPFRLLVVFFHEVSHGLAAILTGGRLETLTIDIYEGGQAVTVGGNFFAIVSAGYLGSLLIGILLVILSVRTDIDRWAMAGLGMGMALIGILYVRELFPLFFCMACGGAFIAIAYYLPPIWSDQILRVIGLISIIYVPFDIFSDTIARPQLRSDATILSENFIGSGAFWGGIWLILSLITIAVALRYLWLAEARQMEHK